MRKFVKSAAETVLFLGCRQIKHFQSVAQTDFAQELKSLDEHRTMKEKGGKERSKECSST